MLFKSLYPSTDFLAGEVDRAFSQCILLQLWNSKELGVGRNLKEILLG